MSKLKRLYLITDGFPFGAGEKPFILPELPYLMEEYDVTIISPAPREVAADKKFVTKLDERITLIHIPPVPPMFDQNFVRALSLHPVMREEAQIISEEALLVPQRLQDAFNNLLNAEIFFRQVMSTGAINLNEPCLVYTYWYNFRPLAFCLHREEFPNMKLITRTHGYDLYNERKPLKRQPFRSFMNQKLDGIFFIAKQGLDYYRQTFTRNIDLAKLHYTPLGVKKISSSRRRIAMNKFQLVSCANVIPHKRVDLIAKALSLLNDNFNIHWTHFGDGSDMPELKTLASELLSNKTNITYWLMGHQNNGDVIRYYSFMDCSCFITTSATEGLPVSLQEALSFGMPIIGTDVGGISEEIDGNGILLPSDPTPEEVARAITEIYNLNGEERLRRRMRSYEIWDERFNIEKNARRFLDILRKL